MVVVFIALARELLFGLFLKGNDKALGIPQHLLLGVAYEDGGILGGDIGIPVGVILITLISKHCLSFRGKLCHEKLRALKSLTYEVVGFSLGIV